MYQIVRKKQTVDPCNLRQWPTSSSTWPWLSIQFIKTMKRVCDNLLLSGVQHLRWTVVI